MTQNPKNENSRTGTPADSLVLNHSSNALKGSSLCY